MIEYLHRWLPDSHTLRNHRALRWLGPSLHHPRLWHISRRGVAMGLAVGVFFGLLIPVVQIPAAATLITNPVTFVPVYYAAYHLGAWQRSRARHRMR